MHLPFGLAVAPQECETRFHRLIILLESLSEALEFCYPVFLYSFEPLIQAFAPSLSQHSGELLDQLIGLGNLRVFLAELVSFIIYPAWVYHIICHAAKHFAPTAFLT